MKLITMDDNFITMFLTNISFDLSDDTEVLEERFRQIFVKLKEIYDLEIEGYYGIDVYIDPCFGIVVEMESEDLEYFDYFDNQVEMRIVLHTDIPILYEFDDVLDIPELLLIKLDVFFDNNKYYGQTKKKLENLEIGYLLEMSKNILYNHNNKNIIRSEKKLDI